MMTIVEDGVHSIENGTFCRCLDTDKGFYIELRKKFAEDEGHFAVVDSIEREEGIVEKVMALSVTRESASMLVANLMYMLSERNHELDKGKPMKIRFDVVINPEDGTFEV